MLGFYKPLTEGERLASNESPDSGEAPVFNEPLAFNEPPISREPSDFGEPSISNEPSIIDDPRVSDGIWGSGEPWRVDEPSIFDRPSGFADPLDSREPTISDEPPAFNEPPVFISTGLVWSQSDREMVAPFEVRTPSDANYFVILIDLSDRQAVLTMYIKGGEIFETSAPLGTFRVRYATGNTWYGERHLFGPGTSTFEVDKDFHFYEDSVSYHGGTIELIKQIGGNLETVPIDPSEFWGGGR